MRSLILQTTANNEIRIGWNDLPARATQDPDPSHVKERERRGHRLEAGIENFLRDNKLFQLRDKDGRLYRGSVSVGYESVEVTQSELDIIREFQRQSEVVHSASRRGYGEAVRPTVFGRSARHQILEAGALFDATCGETHRGYFVTFTLPGSTPEAYDAVSRWSGYLSNIVLQGVRRHCPEALWFYVWELQKRGELHMHLFLGLPVGSDSELLSDRLRAGWYRALESIGDKESICLFSHGRGEFCTVSEFWQYDFQVVTKSPAAYISKYVGKGANAPAYGSEMETNGVRYYPHRWWGMSRALSRAVKEARFKVCMDAMTEEETNACMQTMDGMLTEMEPVAVQEYEAEIGSQRDKGKVIGKIARKIFWFKPEDFPIIDFLFRKLAVAIMKTRPRHLQRWWYDSLNYKGTPIEAI